MLRFAPSPTEDLNLSNLRLAIFNYILSKQLNEDLLIRIEDIEKDKNIDGKDKKILEMLNLFSIEYSHVVYQSENLKYHQKLAMQLMSKKKAFACFCGEEKLEELKEEAKKNGHSFRYDGFCETLSDETVLNVNAPFTVRIKKPTSEIEFIDEIQGKFNATPEDIDSFVILKHDKTPTYNYACAVDDMLNDISMIVREKEYLFDTPKQIHIRDSLSYKKVIKYIHLPNILDSQTNKKIDNKDKENSINWLINEGFLPSAIANYLVLIGNKTPKEIFTLEEAIEWFDIENISKEPSLFNIDTLKDINRKHLKLLEDMRLSKILGFADSDIGKLAKLFLLDVSTIKEIKSIITTIFTPKTNCLGYENEFKKIKDTMLHAPFFENFSDLEKYISEKTGLKDSSLHNPLKYLLIGNQKGPNITDIYPLIKNYIGEIIK